MYFILSLIVSIGLYSCVSLVDGEETKENLKAKITTFKWTPVPLPQISGSTPILNKISANSSHVFLDYRIPTGNTFASGIIIKDVKDNFKVPTNFVALHNGPQNPDLPGFSGQVTALTAFEGGAWLAAAENSINAIIQIDNNGNLNTGSIFQAGSILKLIALESGLLTLKYTGEKTPIFYQGNALKLDKNAIDWNNSSSKNRSSSQLGDAALDMIIANELSPNSLIVVSGGGLYQGNLTDPTWSKSWESDDWASVLIFPGGPRSIAYYQSKLAVGSFTHGISVEQKMGFFFCDLSKVDDKNPCEKKENLRAKNHDIKKMLVFKEYLYLASSTGLLRFDGKELLVFTKNMPKSDLKDTENNIYKSLGALPSDDIIDLAVQDNKLWIITSAGLLSLEVL
jgi:hypothetical protein